MSYTSDNIKVLKGLEPIQKRPGMYTNTENPNHIIEEVIDNSADEALAGFAKTITVTKTVNGEMVVEDDGRGIPVDKHKETGLPAAEMIFTQLHSGGKFDKESDKNPYSFAGGLHGVGVTVTNALSDYVQVDIKKDKKIYTLKFENGVVVKNLRKSGDLERNETGTKVTVKPNPKYFDNPNFDIRAIKKTLQSKSILLNGVKFIYIDEASGEVDEWIYENGVKEYIHSEIDGKELLTEVYSDSNFIDDEESEYHIGEGIEWSVVWIEDGNIRESFVNLIPTPLGGTHELGFRAGLFEAIKRFADQHELMPRGVKLTSDDAVGKATYVISAKILDPQFQGQTKDRLNNRVAVRMISSLVQIKFEQWLNDNIEQAKIIVDGAIKAAQARARKNKKEIIRKTSGVTFLPGKLTDCTSDDVDEREIFFVEGDSAGGSAKQARDKERQAILALRGKPLNTWELTHEDIMTNEEIADIRAAIGIEPHGINDNVDFSQLRYNRVCVLSDADKDGHHIQVLLMALFLRHFPQLITKGHFYICQPPLFRVDVKYKGRKAKKDEKLYLQSGDELELLRRKLKKDGLSDDDIKVTRFKGLGEMNPEQLWETTLSPDTRTLSVVELGDDIEKTIEMLDMLLAKKRSQDRNKWISEKGDLVENEDE